MIRFIKRNKLLSIIILITIIIIISSIFIPALLNTETKKEITNNIINLTASIKDTNQISKNIYNSILYNNIILTILWTLGISIIGIPILLMYYILKTTTYSLETIFLIINIKKTNILFIIIYTIPHLIDILLCFILTYYAISFSIILIKTLLLKKEYNLKIIMKKYIKLYLLLLIGITINSIIEPLMNTYIIKFFL